MDLRERFGAFGVSIFPTNIPFPMNGISPPSTRIEQDSLCIHNLQHEGLDFHGAPNTWLVLGLKLDFLGFMVGISIPHRALHTNTPIEDLNRLEYGANPAGVQESSGKKP